VRIGRHRCGATDPALSGPDSHIRKRRDFERSWDSPSSQELVQVEIPCDVLTRLFREGSVFAAELRSLNSHSRLVIHGAVKSSLM
jgi:hypothetical protein